MEIFPRIFNFTVINWIDTLTSDGRLSLKKPAMFLDQIRLNIGICVEIYNVLNYYMASSVSGQDESNPEL